MAMASISLSAAPEALQPTARALCRFKYPQKGNCTNPPLDSNRAESRCDWYSPLNSNPQPASTAIKSRRQR